MGGVVGGVVKIAGNKSVILAGNRAAAGYRGIKRALRAFLWVVIGGWGMILRYMEGFGGGLWCKGCFLQVRG